MKFLWIILHGPTYWFEHTDQGDEDPLGSFLAFPWQPPPVFCTALILIYNFEGWQFNKGGSNCCSFDLRQTKVSAHHLSVHGHVCKLETCSKRVQISLGLGTNKISTLALWSHLGIWDISGPPGPNVHSLTLKVVRTFFHLDRWGNSWMSLMW